jgi:DMSO reductase anchor subunit
VAAVLTYLPVIALAVEAGRHSWLTPMIGVETSQTELRVIIPIPLASLLVLTGSVATLFCTANIYACLKPVGAWHNRYVPASYLLLGVYTGALCTWALTTLSDGRVWSQGILLVGVVVMAATGAILKLVYWRHVDRDARLSTGDATGLKGLGHVRSFEHPHTEENYLTQEMGFRLARKHSRSLRLICLIAGFAVPGLLALLGLAIPGFETAAAWVALPSGVLGIFVERWLFFAEAKHTVMLYYGTRDA